MRQILCLFVLMVLPQEFSASPLTKQFCYEDGCVQVAKNFGIINLEAQTAEISMNNGIVTFIRAPGDVSKIQHYSLKVKNLEKQINAYLVKLEVEENRRLSGIEKIQLAQKHTAELFEQIEQLSQQVALLDQKRELTRQIIAAKNVYNIPLVKKLLKSKLTLEDEEAARTAFTMGLIQNLDLAFEEAYLNFDKAAYLVPNNSVYLNQAGVQAILTHKSQNAVDFFEQALAVNLASFDEGDRAIRIIRQNLGAAWHQQGCYEDARRYYREAERSRAKSSQEEGFEHYTATGFYHGENSRMLQSLQTLSHWLAHQNNSLGLVWFYKGDYNKAIEYFKHSLSANVKSYGQSHLNVADTYNNLGLAWQAKGNQQKASTQFRRALAIYQKQLGATNSKTSRVYENLVTSQSKEKTI